jgi:hypothetical protein
MADEVRPAYRIPDEKMVQTIVHQVMKDNGIIRSQTLLHRLIKDKLKEMDADVSLKIAPQRLRRIAAGMPGMKMMIYCRESNEVWKGNRCPVCGSSMQTIRNQTLYGWTVNTGKFCPKCNYWTGGRMRKPVRYVFMLDESDRR